MDYSVLIIDDEIELADSTAEYFNMFDIKSFAVYTAEDAINFFKNNTCKLILLDINLGNASGFELCKRLRKDYDIPILFISARSSDDDMVIALNIGGDDYITKPYSNRELTARVKANLRRSSYEAPVSTPTQEPSTIYSGELSINTERYEVTKSGKIVDITLREFELLKFLAMQPARIFSREQLLENVWGYEYYGDVRTVDVTVRRLREKIEDDPSMPKYIITKRGVGYYFNA